MRTKQLPLPIKEKCPKFCRDPLQLVHSKVVPSSPPQVWITVNLRAAQPRDCFQVPTSGNLKAAHSISTLPVLVQAPRRVAAEAKPREGVWPLMTLIQSRRSISLSLCKFCHHLCIALLWQNTCFDYSYSFLEHAQFLVKQVSDRRKAGFCCKTGSDVTFFIGWRIHFRLWENRNESFVIHLIVFQRLLVWYYIHSISRDYQAIEERAIH